MHTRRYFTIKEAAGRLGVSQERCERMIMSYGVKVAPVTNRLTMISREELDRLIELRRRVVSQRAVRGQAARA